MRVVMCADIQKDMGTIRRELDAYSTAHPKCHVGIDEYDAETDALHRMEKGETQGGTKIPVPRRSIEEVWRVAGEAVRK